MAQSDLTIQNQSFPSFRSDLNDALTALNTTQSGTSRPTSAVAGTIWLDTTNATNPTLKFYDGADDISLATIDYSANTVNWLDSTVVADLVNDTTPQLGGMLDVNGQAIGNGTEELIKFSETASAVNEVTVTNSATGNAPELSATGDDTNIDIKITPKGSGNVVLDGLKYPNADGTLGQALQTDGSGNLSFASVGGGKVLQVVSTVVSGTVIISTNNTPVDITGLSATITPSSASNKILILYKINYSNASGDTFVGNLLRGATTIFQGNSGTGQQGTLSFQTANMNNYWSFEAGGSFLDSPNTTSATTYKFQADNNSNLTMYFNRTARGGSDDPLTSSSITLMEIGS